ncbi:RNA polymerase sigma-E factor [Actinoplanes sp. SE50]|uniref:SigE family RNA polymerase sigma factor n=1 Tax=unclassified Actinoplanes TaxID=2626549 RepID=UPI00023ED303|nr:RNA polymerase sigma-E factor [Actinoplanes sp. SE50/110]ATO85703.1 RNA polymerase sigma-E factor [Actinoplanes sp. SE50]SLM03116.1 hypothetical protein ACSP50_6405 [Actinoplanes sp. SE50/110]
MAVSSDEEFTRFVAARLPALRRLAYHLCGDMHQADDLIQEAVTKLFVRWPLRDVGNLDGYLRTMLVRTFIDERRRGWWRIRLFAHPGDDSLPGVVPASGDAFPIADRTDLQAALARLPRRQQAVLVLRFLYDQPIDVVATMLGCSSGTVKSQTARGLAAMRTLIGDPPAGTGPVGAGSAGTGSAGTGSAGAGSGGTGSVGTGSAGTGSVDAVRGALR